MKLKWIKSIATMYLCYYSLNANNAIAFIHVDIVVLDTKLLHIIITVLLRQRSSVATFNNKNKNNRYSSVAPKLYYFS